jgi:chromosome segregation ATPase
LQGRKEELGIVLLDARRQIEAGKARGKALLKQLKAAYCQIASSEARDKDNLAKLEASRSDVSDTKEQLAALHEKMTKSELEFSSKTSDIERVSFLI